MKRFQASDFSSKNLTKTSGTYCPGSEMPLTYLNNQIFVLPLGSNVFSQKLFTHSFITLSVSLFLSLSVPLCFPLISLYIFTFAIVLESKAYLPAASKGKQAAISELGSGRDVVCAQCVCVFVCVGEGRGSKFPGWLADISKQSPHFRRKHIKRFFNPQLTIAFRRDHTNCLAPLSLIRADITLPGDIKP